MLIAMAMKLGQRFDIAGGAVPRDVPSPPRVWALPRLEVLKSYWHQLQHLRACVIAAGSFGSAL